jgi:hypothetical protein
MARTEPAAPSFLRRNVANDLDRPDTGAEFGSIEADMREAMADGELTPNGELPGSPYAPKRNVADMRALEQAIQGMRDEEVRPLHATAVAISELRYHDMVDFAQGVIVKSDALKSIPPHELAAALNGWALQARSPAP